MALTSAIASAYLSVSRWKLSTQPLPDKVIVIGAPHTSNWDGVFMAISLWKSGFYRIAMEAGVPIQLGFIDRNTRTFGWGPTYQLTGDVRADMEVIRAFYADKVGIRPEKTSVPRLRAEDEAA